MRHRALAVLRGDGMVESLALNMAGIPMDIVSWKKAVTLWALGRAVVLAEYEDKIIRSPRFSMRIPAVVQCLDVKSIPKNFVTSLPLTRRNLYLRDNGRCVYCGQKISLASFTIDHVIPRSKGGTTEWNNLVTACMACNNKKGNKRWKRGEIFMTHQPFVPRLTKAAPRNLVNKLCFREPHRTWLDYIYWNVALPKSTGLSSAA